MEDVRFLTLFVYLTNEKHYSVSGGSVAHRQRLVTEQTWLSELWLNIFQIIIASHSHSRGKYSLHTFKHPTYMPKLGGLSP